MVKKTGLGKGLDALFADNKVPEEEKQQEGEIVQLIKTIAIEPNRNQPRKRFDEEKLEELANSIKQYGIIQPIIATKKDKYYEIVAGERRWRAAKIAGLTEVPVLVRNDDAKKNQEIALIENIQREDLNPIEKARGIKSLMEDYDMTQEKAASMIGMSRSALANTVRLLNLDPRVLKLAEEGKLSEGHCRALMATEDGEKQYQMALHIIETGGTVRDVENKVYTVKKLKKKDKKYEAVFKDIENSFQSFFGTKVKLDAGTKKGKIIIQYTSNEELERLLELIK